MFGTFGCLGIVAHSPSCALLAGTDSGSTGISSASNSALKRATHSSSVYVLRLRARAVRVVELLAQLIGQAPAPPRELAQRVGHDRPVGRILGLALQERRRRGKPHDEILPRDPHGPRVGDHRPAQRVFGADHLHHRGPQLDDRVEVRRGHRRRSGVRGRRRRRDRRGVRRGLPRRLRSPRLCRDRSFDARAQIRRRARRWRLRGGSSSPLETLYPRQQRPCGCVHRGLCGLHERQLEAGTRVRAGADALHRLPQQLQQADDHGVLHALCLLGERGVGLGRERQLCGYFIEALHHQQLPCTHLQVRGERARVAPLLDVGGECRQGSPDVARRDRIDRLFEETRIGDAKHREHILEHDLRARVGDELLERPQRVAEAARRRARQRGDRRRGDLDRLGLRRAPHDARDLLDRRAVEVEAVAAVHDRRAGPSAPRSSPARTRCSAAAPRASSETHSTRPSRACGPRRGCTPSAGPTQAHRRPPRAARGCPRPSCSTPRPSRSRPMNSPGRSRCTTRTPRKARSSAPARSSGTPRGSSPSRSSPCRASRRTGRRGAPSRARPRFAACAPPAPGPPARRTCADGACGTGTAALAVALAVPTPWLSLPTVLPPSKPSRRGYRPRS